MKRLSHNVCAWTLVAAVCVLPGSSIASAAPINRVDTASVQLQRTELKRRFLEQPAVDAIPSLYKDEADDVGPQFVLKVAKPRKQWLEASADLQFGYTSNMNLTEEATTETSLLVSTAQIAVAPEPFTVAGGQLALRAGYRTRSLATGCGAVISGISTTPILT
jgi:hypothetical protein